MVQPGVYKTTTHNSPKVKRKTTKPDTNLTIILVTDNIRAKLLYLAFSVQLTLPNSDTDEALTFDLVCGSNPNDGFSATFRSRVAPFLN